MTIRARKDCAGCGIRFTPERDNQTHCGECHTYNGQPERDVDGELLEEVPGEFDADERRAG